MAELIMSAILLFKFMLICVLLVVAAIGLVFLLKALIYLIVE